MRTGRVIKLEQRTARLTLLIDPRKKTMFERLCAEEDVTPSQMVRRLIRSYIERQLGRPWNPDAEALAPRTARKAVAAAAHGSGRQRAQRR